MPPGETTMSLSSAGCLPVSITSLALPNTVCNANVLAMSRGIPTYTPASINASMNRKT